jgi:putative lipase involved disintegration of autophagic bodies
MRDVITDMSADIGYFNVDHLTNQACHLGILKGSENVYDRIKSHNLLESAYRTNPNYTLLVTGHSLGAATATVLACKLKAEYPSVRCIAYSPPGGFISAELAEYTKSFVMSVIIGDDIVPRLSIISVHNLKADILKEIYSTSLPKYKIIWKYSMSFVSNDNQVVAAATTDSDEEGLSSIDSSTNSNNNNYNNKDDLDNSHNSNCLIDFDSANEGQLRDGQIIKQETGQTTVVTEITNVALTAITAIKSTAKSVISSATSTQVIEDEEFIMKQSIVGYTTARELMTKVYDSYVELELPGNILYIYQINPRNAGSRAGCLKWWQNSCASVFFCSKKSKKQMQYDSRWANNEEFKKILITNRMLMDHFPNNIQDALSYFNTTDRII